MQVPRDQVGTPTYAPNLARAAMALAEKEARGVFHVAGPVLVSRDEFAREAARVFSLSPELIQPVASSEFNRLAPRPLQAGLVTSKAQAELPFPLLDYRSGLRLFQRALEADEPSPASRLRSGVPLSAPH